MQFSTNKVKKHSNVHALIIIEVIYLLIHMNLKKIS